MSARSHLAVVSPDEASALAELLARVVAGDRQGIGAFFDRFEPEVNRLVWRLLGADADHDDVVNQAFETMLARVGEVHTPSSLPGWVRAVTVNAVRMTVRGRRWRRFFSFEATDDEVLAHPDLRVPDEQERERLRLLYRALSQLNADDRSVLVLRHLEGLELTEVAEAMSCSLATLKRWLARAETRLAARLKGTTS